MSGVHGVSWLRFTPGTTSAACALDRIRAVLPQPWEHSRDLPCDDRCVCPDHGTPLLYWPAGGDHACQDVECRYGRGMRTAGPVRPGEEPMG